MVRLAHSYPDGAPLVAITGQVGTDRLYIPVVGSAPGCESGQIVRVKLGRYDGERVRAALC